MVSLSRTDFWAVDRRPDGVLQCLLNAFVVTVLSGLKKNVGGCGQESVRLREIVRQI